MDAIDPRYFYLENEADEVDGATAETAASGGASGSTPGATSSWNQNNTMNNSMMNSSGMNSGPNSGFNSGNVTVKSERSNSGQNFFGQGNNQVKREGHHSQVQAGNREVVNKQEIGINPEKSPAAVPAINPKSPQEAESSATQEMNSSRSGQVGGVDLVNGVNNNGLHNANKNANNPLPGSMPGIRSPNLSPQHTALGGNSNTHRGENSAKASTAASGLSWHNPKVLKSNGSTNGSANGMNSIKKSNWLGQLNANNSIDPEISIDCSQIVPEIEIIAS
jgi:hypothetical protein